jgi:hypothetical protein
MPSHCRCISHKYPGPYSSAHVDIGFRWLTRSPSNDIRPADWRLAGLTRSSRGLGSTVARLARSDAPLAEERGVMEGREENGVEGFVQQ